MTMCRNQKQKRGEAGFTLVETTIAMVIILVAMLGVAFSLTYAINFNSGNASRAKCLAVLQQEVERMRSAKFTPGYTDPLIQGGANVRTVTSNGNNFTITTVVDNGPFTSGVQDETVFTTIKEITVSAQLAAPSPGWQTAVPATFVLRRVRSN